MVKYLSALKNKKGFTLIELVVVFAVLAVVIAIMLGSASDRESNMIVQATDNAASFMTATQLAFTRAEFTERSLVDYAGTDVQYIKYTEGRNVMLNDTTADTEFQYMFIEVMVDNSSIEYLHLSDKIDLLMNRSESDAMTKLEQYFLQQIDSGLAEAYDGYFYAVIDSGFRVVVTHFTETRLPMYASSMTAADYRDKITFTDENKINDCIVGTWGDAFILASKGAYALTPFEMGDAKLSAYNAKVYDAA